MSTKPWKSNDHIHLDRQARTQKNYTLLALIFAAYQSMESLKQDSKYKDILNNNIESIMQDTSIDTTLVDEIKQKYKEEVIGRLKSSLELFRSNQSNSTSGAGTYGVDEGKITNQFYRTYTPALEFGAYINSELDLSPNAVKVASGEITIKEYIDATFLNYICIVNDKSIHVISRILSFMKDNNLKKVSRDTIKDIFKENIDEDGIKTVLEWMASGTFFKRKNDVITIAPSYSIEYLLSRCNITYDNKSLEEIKQSDLRTQEGYARYVSNFNILEDEEQSSGIKENKKNLGENIIYYGAPGTGKSHNLDEKSREFDFVERVTFYPEYTHDDFIGCYMPCMSYVKNDTTEYIAADGTSSTLPGKPVPYYTYIPGPFTIALVNALNNPDKDVLLIVEELNRANAAAVFGEFFQLLDRKDGASKYKISVSNEYSEYLSNKVATYTKGQKVAIPSNFTICATMNSADQGVNPLDSAFKRRWTFKYVPIDFSKIIHKNHEINYVNGKVTWEVFATTINEQLKKKEINEDKHLGQYFVNEVEITDLYKFASKILLYLFDDVLKFNRRGFFKNDYKTFSDLLNAFIKGEKIFEFDFQSLLLNDKSKETNIYSSEVTLDTEGRSQVSEAQEVNYTEKSENLDMPRVAEE